MIIQKSYADCSGCPLLENPSCILETNCENLSKVEVIFIAENPGKDEIKHGIPLIGASGQVFRKYFKRFHNFRYLITNTVLCQTLKTNRTTGNPSWYITERCRVNCFKIIEICNPSLIIAMGSTAMRAFGIARTGILDKRGHVYKWRQYDLFLTVHPSYVMRMGAYIDFNFDLKRARKILIANLLKNKSKMKKKSYSCVNLLQSFER